jgi:hypothetical protein
MAESSYRQEKYEAQGGKKHKYQFLNGNKFTSTVLWLKGLLSWTIAYPLSAWREKKTGNTPSLGSQVFLGPDNSASIEWPLPRHGFGSRPRENREMRRVEKAGRRLR